MKNIILLLFLGLALNAAAADKPQPPVKFRLVPLKPAPALQPAQPSSSGRKIAAIPGRTIRLLFKLSGEEGENESFQVLCAGGRFVIDLSHSGPDFEHTLSFTGNLTPTGAKDNIPITFHINQTHEDKNEGNRGQQTLSGSATLKPGKATSLGSLGEQIITVTATIEE